MPGIPYPGGDFGSPVLYDFNGGTSEPGWTSSVTGTGAANTAGSASAATMALGRMSGGVVSVVGTTATGIAAMELQGMTINNANGQGIEAECLMMFDTALPTATNSYVYMFGIFDSAGAVSTGNFIGLMFGWNASIATPAISNQWYLAADTVAHLISSSQVTTLGLVPIPAPAPGPVATLPPAIALDVPQLLRFRIESLLPQQPIGQSASWIAVKGIANSVSPAQGPMVANLGLNVYPAGFVPPSGFPNITNGWLGFKALATAGTANTGKMLTDAVSYVILNRFTMG